MSKKDNSSFHRVCEKGVEMKKIVTKEEFLKIRTKSEYEDYKFMILQSNMYDIWKLKKITNWILVISIANLLLVLTKGVIK